MSGEIIEKKVESARDVLVLGLETAEHRIADATSDITKKEYNWEPLSEIERLSDLLLPPDSKKVWRVFQNECMWTYDYTPERLEHPPFTTIAWIMNHIAQTGDMYLYCVKTGKPEGVDRRWDDLPVFSNCKAMRDYIFKGLSKTREYLNSIGEERISDELNKLTPLPWGEMSPSYMNLWGGIIAHTIEHAAQIAGHKHRIRYGY